MIHVFFLFKFELLSMSFRLFKKSPKISVKQELLQHS